jgi:type II secretory pathway pseudopilin PulG
MALRVIRRAGSRLAGERGSLLVELVIAMTLLAVGVGALMSVYASSSVSLSHASIEGNALTVAEKQMETLRSGSYSDIALNASTIPSASDRYATDPPSNLTSTQRSSITSGQQTGGTISATQTVTGPDGRHYRLDTYVFGITPPSGQTALQVSVAARLVTGTSVGAVRARLVTSFDVGGTRDAT